MRVKIIAIVLVLISVILLAVFGSGITGKLTNRMAEDIPEYGCGENSFCTSCIIEGNPCSCGKDVCDCGGETVDKKECSLFLA